MVRGKLHLLGFEDWLGVGPKGAAPFLPNPSRLLIEHAMNKGREKLLAAAGCTDLSAQLLPVPRQGDSRQNFEGFYGVLDSCLQQVEPGDLVLGMGQNGPWRGSEIFIETVFPGRFQALDLGPNQTLVPERVQAFEAAISNGTLTGFRISQDAGVFYCNALGWVLDGSFFLHLPGLNGPEERAPFFSIYSEQMLSQGASFEQLSCASVEQNFRGVCQFLSVASSFRVDEPQR